jgi:hypothetical protein
MAPAVLIADGNHVCAVGAVVVDEEFTVDHVEEVARHGVLPVKAGAQLSLCHRRPIWFGR